MLSLQGKNLVFFVKISFVNKPSVRAAKLEYLVQSCNQLDLKENLSEFLQAPLSSQLLDGVYYQT